MDFKASPLYNEVKTITETKSEDTAFYSYTAIVHIPDGKVEPMTIMSIENLKDYEECFGEEHTIKLAFGLGTYVKRIYKNRNFLEITLIRKPVSEDKNAVDDKSKVLTKRYMAILFEETSDVVLEADGNAEITEETLNRSDMVTPDFQLVDKALYKLRMKLIGGIYRATTGEEVLRATLQQESSDLGLPEEESPKKTDIRPANIKYEKVHIIIPHGTRLVDFPTYLQKEVGVYNTGMGRFYEDQTWFVYPLYDTTQFDKLAETLTIINIPSKQLPGIERTFRYDAGNLTILATGKIKFQDDSEKNDLNHGNGVRYMNADNVMGKSSISNGNKSVVNRAKNNTEVTSGSRKSGENFAPMSSQRITSNTAAQMSPLAARGCSAIQVLWENANPDLLRPAMPVRIMYLDGEVVKTIYGSLLKTQELTRTLEAPFLSDKYVTNIVLVVAVNRGVTVNA